MTQRILSNYHTHTYRCGHATGDIPDYVRAAMEAGLETLGMSEHTPLPVDFMSFMRMRMEEMDDYFALIEASRRPGIRLLKSFECDILPEHFSFYREELLGKRGCDYLIGAQHWHLHRGDWLYVGHIDTAAELRGYTKALIQGIESGLFDFIAHPDHFAAGYLEWDSEAQACSRDIIEAARGKGVLLEINGNGFRKRPVKERGRLRPPYPHRKFWELAAELKASVLCSSDAHRPEDTAASLDLCLALANELELAVPEPQLGIPKTEQAI